MDKIFEYYIDWKSKPRTKGSPQNIEEFCEKHGIQKSDIALFHQRADFGERLFSSSLNWARSKVPELLHSAYEEIRLSKDMSDIERFINIVHELKRKKDAGSGNQFNFFNLDESKLKQIAARTIRASVFSGSVSEGETTQLLSDNK